MKTCEKCRKEIDRSDATTGFAIVTLKDIPQGSDTRFYLCESCAVDLMQGCYEMAPIKA